MCVSQVFWNLDPVIPGLPYSKKLLIMGQSFWFWSCIFVVLQGRFSFDIDSLRTPSWKLIQNFSFILYSLYVNATKKPEIAFFPSATRDLNDQLSNFDWNDPRAIRTMAPRMLKFHFSKNLKYISMSTPREIFPE